MADTLRVVIAGGGTGGHLYPGIAVARELLSRLPETLISFAAAVTFDTTQTFFRGKGFVSGNPVRPEFLATAEPQQEWTLDEHSSVTRILVFGGSQGAHAINMAMVEAAARLAASPHLRLTHQTGDRDVEMVRAAYREAGLSAHVEPFLYDMGRQLGQADVIVCRAGATTGRAGSSFDRLRTSGFVRRSW